MRLVASGIADMPIDKMQAASAPLFVDTSAMPPGEVAQDAPPPGLAAYPLSVEHSSTHMWIFEASAANLSHSLSNLRSVDRPDPIMSELLGPGPDARFADCGPSPGTGVVDDLLSQGTPPSADSSAMLVDGTGDSTVRSEDPRQVYVVQSISAFTELDAVFVMAGDDPHLPCPCR